MSLISSGAVLRLHVRRKHRPYPFLLTLDATGRDVGLDGMQSPKWLSALLTHSSGTSWPDRRGEDLIRAILQHGGVVALAFKSRADMHRCHSRIQSDGR